MDREKDIEFILPASSVAKRLSDKQIEKYTIRNTHGIMQPVQIRRMSNSPDSLLIDLQVIRDSIHDDLMCELDYYVKEIEEIKERHRNRLNDKEIDSVISVARDGLETIDCMRDKLDKLIEDAKASMEKK